MRKINPKRAKRALQIMSALPVSQKHKAVIQEILDRSSSEIPAVLQMLGDMDTTRQETVIQTAHDIHKATNRHLKKSREQLMEMSEAEWQALVDEANDDEPTT